MQITILHHAIDTTEPQRKLGLSHWLEVQAVRRRLGQANPKHNEAAPTPNGKNPDPPPQPLHPCFHESQPPPALPSIGQIALRAPGAAVGRSSVGSRSYFARTG